jgi:hypothetical protein
MKRIFLGLAVLNGAALLASFVSGFWLPDAYFYHFVLGLYTVIFNLGLHCLIFIYFLGTGRWVKETALAYQIPDEPLPKLTRELKRRTFPPALAAMLVPIAAAAAGMGTQLQEWPAWLHWVLAGASLLVNAWACWVEYVAVRTNGAALDAVLAEVDRIRVARGLPPNAEALLEEQSR